MFDAQCGTTRGVRRRPRTGGAGRIHPGANSGLPISVLLGEKFADRHLQGDGEPVKYVHRNISGLALHVGDERTVDPALLGEIILRPVVLRTESAEVLGKQRPGCRSGWFVSGSRHPQNSANIAARRQ